MHPPVKDQTSIGEEDVIMTFDPSTDLTRQEFKDDTDITKILHRFGVPQRTNPQYGNYDYTLDLQGAMEALTEANQAVERLPEPLRAKYGSIQALQDGIITGEFQKDYEKHREQVRIENEDRDYAARTAAHARAVARQREAENREAFEEFKRKNPNLKPTQRVTEDEPE